MQIKHFGILTFLMALCSTGFAQIQLEELQGDWSCFDTGCEKRMCETCCRNMLYFDLKIHNDSVDVFDYPNKFIGTYRIESYIDSLNNRAYKVDMPTFLRQPRVSNDTLTTEMDFSFRRNAFDDEIVSILLKDSLIFTNLLGEWEIVLKYPGSSMNSGDVKLPFNITDKLNFSSDSELLTKRFLQIAVNGELKLFYIRSITNYSLKVTAKSWYTGQSCNYAHDAWYLNFSRKFIIEFRKVVD